MGMITDHPYEPSIHDVFHVGTSRYHQKNGCSPDCRCSQCEKPKREHKETAETR